MPTTITLFSLKASASLYSMLWRHLPENVSCPGEMGGSDTSPFFYENMCSLVEICKWPFCERTWKVRQGHCWTDVLAWTDQHCIKNVSLFLSILVHSHNVPLTGNREIWPLCDSLHFGLKHVKRTHARKHRFAGMSTRCRNAWNITKIDLKSDVSVQVKVIGVEPEVLQQLSVVHVVWIISRRRKIAETHDLFGGVGHQGAVNAAFIWLYGLLQMEGEIVDL